MFPLRSIIRRAILPRLPGRGSGGKPILPPLWPASGCARAGKTPRRRGNGFLEAHPLQRWKLHRGYKRAGDLQGVRQALYGRRSLNLTGSGKMSVFRGQPIFPRFHICRNQGKMDFRANPAFPLCIPELELIPEKSL